MALEVALTQAEFANTQLGEEIEIVALHLVPPDMDVKEIDIRRNKLIDELELEDLPIELRITPSRDVVNDILTYSEKFDEIVIGAPEERLLEQGLFGSVPQKVAEEAVINVIMVKRHQPIKHGILGRYLGRVPARKSYGQD
jgi:nucleotide-binding universal stress UspA family protein